MNDSTQRCLEILSHYYYKNPYICKAVLEYNKNVCNTICGNKKRGIQCKQFLLLMDTGKLQKGPRCIRHLFKNKKST